MKRLTKSTFILLYLFITATKTFAAENALIIQREEVRYTIISAQAYATSVQVSGVNFAESEQTLKFAIAENSSLQDVSLSVIVKGKTKKLNTDNYLSLSTIDWSAFYSGSKIYLLHIPPLSEFILNYEVKGEHSITLSKLYKEGIFNAETNNTRFQLPEGYVMSMNNGLQLRGEITISDTLFKDKETLYYLIHDEHETPEDFFSEWFFSRTEPLSQLKPELVPVELENIHRSGDKTQLSKACFEFVQQKIRYIDIENGIHAIIPRDCNETMLNKYGDCKDMATLLHALYNHFEIESYLGISRTFHREDTFNFPSVAMANHMIVALKTDNGFLYMDATEDECLFKDPSSQILGTETFLLGYKKGYFQKVSNTPFYRPEVKISYLIKPLESGYQIDATFQVNGKTNGLFRSLSEAELSNNDQLITYFNYIVPEKLEITNRLIADTMSHFSLQWKLAGSAVTTVGKQLLLDPSVLPDIHQLNQFFTGMECPTYIVYYTIELKNITPGNTTQTIENASLSVKDSGCIITCSTTCENLKKEGSMAVWWKNLTLKPLKIKI